MEKKSKKPMKKVFTKKMPPPPAANIESEPKKANMKKTREVQYADDEPITILAPQEEVKHASDIPSSIAVYTQFGFNYLQLSSTSVQEVPCSLTLEAKASTQPDVSSERPGIDLVCVIDRSGSMSGEKINLVQQTLSFMVEKLSDNDRVCLIIFDDTYQRICPLSAMNQEGKQRMLQLIDSIRIGGTTNIIDAMKCGLQVLADRRIVNSVSSVLLLTDGIDDRRNNAFQRAQAAFANVQVTGGCVIHTFGYGDNHDADLLNAIAEEKNGSFYFVQNDETIAEAFSNCLGELISVVADQIEVRLSTQPCEVPFSLSKVYSESGDSTFRMPSLLSADKKEAIFLLQFPPSEDRVPENLRIQPVRGIVRYRLVETGTMQEQEFVLDIRVENADYQGEIEVDTDVMVNFYRVKAADILKEATALGDNQMYSQAREILQKGSEELLGCIVAADPLVQVLANDLIAAVDRFRDRQTWSHGGKAAVASKAKSHWMKRGEEVDVYQNCVQKSLKVEAKSKIKKKF